MWLCGARWETSFLAKVFALYESGDFYFVVITLFGIGETQFFFKIYFINYPTLKIKITIFNKQS